MTPETSHMSWTDKKAAKTSSRLNPKEFLGLASQLETLMASRETLKPGTSDSKCAASVRTVRLLAIKISNDLHGHDCQLKKDEASYLLIDSSRSLDSERQYFCLVNAQDRGITSSIRDGDSVSSSFWSGFEMRMCSNSISCFDTFQRLALEEETNILTFLVIWINLQEENEPENRNNVVFVGNIEFYDVILLLEIKT